MLNLPDINKQLGHKDLFATFKLQLEKDFEQSNFPTEFIKPLQPDFRQIQTALTRIFENNEFSSQQNIMQLIYRIDISEAQLKKYLVARNTENYFEVIAELIIKRVLQKVVLREQFKKDKY